MAKRERVVAWSRELRAAHHRGEGVEAVMKSHFRDEERQLLTVLQTLELATDPRRVLGPL